MQKLREFKITRPESQGILKGIIMHETKRKKEMQNYEYDD